MVVRCVAAQSSDHEAMFAVGNLAYLAMAVFVAWGRSGPESFTG